jgi:hypothetical protein
MMTVWIDTRCLDTLCDVKKGAFAPFFICNKPYQGIVFAMRCSSVPASASAGT